MRLLPARTRPVRLLAGLAAPLVLLALALAWCAPALVHGTVFGSFDTALNAGLGAPLAGTVHSLVNGDQARQGAAWASLDWRAVHSGKLPLWNPYDDLGLPELANFQSAALSLPALVSYLAPLSAAYTVEVVVKLFVAGLGCYVAARVLGVSRISALLAGVAGELAGPMAAWAGWPQTAVAEWTGWLVAFIVLAWRRPGWKSAAGLAVVVGFAFAGGFPEVLLLLGAAGALLALALLAGDLRRRWLRRGAGVGPGAVAGALRPPGRPLAVLGAGFVGGGLFAAPAWLTALPVLHMSVSSLRPTQTFFGPSMLALFVDPTFWGLPTTTSTWFGPGGAGDYYETAAFVGPLVLACALLAVVRRRRQPAVIGLALAAVLLTLAAIGTPPIRQLALDLPGVRTVAFSRALLVVCALLAILAALGLEELRTRRPGWAGWGAFGGVTAVTVALAALSTTSSGLTAVERRERLDGFLLAGAGLVVLALFLAGRELAGRWPALAGVRRRFRVVPAGAVGALLVVAVEAVTLVLATFSTNTWSRVYLPRSGAIDAYADLAGAGLVALGGGHPPTQPPRLGLYPELNAAYGVRELAGYDATTPRALYELWASVSPAPDLTAAQLAGDVTQFAPDVETAAEARALGVSYVLEPLHGALHLVGDASSCVSAALGRAGIASAATTTGVLDDLAWYTEEAGIRRAFPSRRTGYLGRYLAAEAASPATVPLPPVASGVPAAQAVVGAAAHDPALVGGLGSCLTLAPDPSLVRVATLGTEVLYRVPGPAGAYFGSPPSGPPGASGDTSGASDDRRSAPMGRVDSSLVYTENSRATVTVTAARPAWLTVTVDDEPGWSAATASGQVLPTRRSGALLQVRVPPGRHVIVVHYWPKWLSLALGLSGAALVALAAFGAADVLGGRRRRRRSRARYVPSSAALAADDEPVPAMSASASNR